MRPANPVAAEHVHRAGELVSLAIEELRPVWRDVPDELFELLDDLIYELVGCEARLWGRPFPGDDWDDDDEENEDESDDGVKDVPVSTGDVPPWLR